MLITRTSSWTLILLTICLTRGDDDRPSNNSTTTTTASSSLEDQPVRDENGVKIVGKCQGYYGDVALVLDSGLSSEEWLKVKYFADILINSIANSRINQIKKDKTRFGLVVYGSDGYIRDLSLEYGDMDKVRERISGLPQYRADPTRNREVLPGNVTYGVMSLADTLSHMRSGYPNAVVFLTAAPPHPQGDSVHEKYTQQIDQILKEVSITKPVKIFSVGLVLADASKPSDPGLFSKRVDQMENVLQKLSSYGRSENGYWLLEDTSYLASTEFAALIAERLCYVDAPSYVPYGGNHYGHRKHPAKYYGHGYDSNEFDRGYNSYEDDTHSARPRNYYHHPRSIEHHGHSHEQHPHSYEHPGHSNEHHGHSHEQHPHSYEHPGHSNEHHGHSHEQHPHSYEHQGHPKEHHGHSHEHHGHSEHHPHHDNHEHKNQHHGNHEETKHPDLRQAPHKPNQPQSPPHGGFETNLQQYNPESGEDITLKEKYYDEHFNVVQECRHIRADIVFVVDCTKAHDEKYWNGIKDYFANLASSIYGGNDGRVRFGMIVYGNGYKNSFYLKDYTAIEDVRHHITKLERFSDSTDHKVWEAMKGLRQEQFNPFNGARKDAAHVAVIFADSKVNQYEKVEKEVIEVQRARIKTYSIGMVHPDSSYERLVKMMASPPRRKDQNYWYMNNYDFMSSKIYIQSIAREICRFEFTRAHRDGQKTTRFTRQHLDPHAVEYYKAQSNQHGQHGQHGHQPHHGENHQGHDGGYSHQGHNGHVKHPEKDSHHYHEPAHQQHGHHPQHQQHHEPHYSHSKEYSGERHNGHDQSYKPVHHGRHNEGHYNQNHLQPVSHGYYNSPQQHSNVRNYPPPPLKYEHHVTPVKNYREANVPDGHHHHHQPHPEGGHRPHNIISQPHHGEGHPNNYPHPHHHQSHHHEGEPHHQQPEKNGAIYPVIPVMPHEHVYKEEKDVSPSKGRFYYIDGKLIYGIPVVLNNEDQHNQPHSQNYRQAPLPSTHHHNHPKHPPPHRPHRENRVHIVPHAVAPLNERENQGESKRPSFLELLLQGIKNNPPSTHQQEQHHQRAPQHHQHGNHAVEHYREGQHHQPQHNDHHRHQPNVPHILNDPQRSYEPHGQHDSPSYVPQQHYSDNQVQYTPQNSDHVPHQQIAHSHQNNQGSEHRHLQDQRPAHHHFNPSQNEPNQNYNLRKGPRNFHPEQDQGPRDYDPRQGPPSKDYDSRHPSQHHYQGPPPQNYDHRKGSSQHHDQGPPENYDPREGPPQHHDQGPAPDSYDPREGPSRHHDQGPPPDSYDPREGPSRHHDQGAPPDSYDPREGPSRHYDQGPPSQNYDQRHGPPQHHDQRPPQVYDSRQGPSQHHDQGPPPQNYDPRQGPSVHHDQGPPPQNYDPRHGPPQHHEKGPHPQDYDPRHGPPSHHHDQRETHPQEDYDPRQGPPPHHEQGPPPQGYDLRKDAHPQGHNERHGAPHQDYDPREDPHLQQHDERQGPHPRDYDQRQGPPQDYDPRQASPQHREQGPPNQDYDQQQDPHVQDYDPRRGPHPPDFDPRQGPPQDYEPRHGPHPQDYDPRQGPPPPYHDQGPPQDYNPRHGPPPQNHDGGHHQGPHQDYRDHEPRNGPSHHEQNNPDTHFNPRQAPRRQDYNGPPPREEYDLRQSSPQREDYDPRHGSPTRQDYNGPPPRQDYDPRHGPPPREDYEPRHGPPPPRQDYDPRNGPPPRQSHGPRHDSREDYNRRQDHGQQQQRYDPRDGPHQNQVHDQGQGQSDRGDGHSNVKDYHNNYPYRGPTNPQRSPQIHHDTQGNGPSHQSSGLSACNSYSGDVVFLIDTTAKHMDEDAWKRMKQFFNAVAEVLIAASNDIKVGVMVYGRGFRSAFHLNDHSDPEEMKKAITNLERYSDTSTPYLWDALYGLRTEMFSPARGARADKPHVGVIFLSYFPGQEQRIEEEIKRAHEEKIKTLSIGINHETNFEDAISKMSSPPKRPQKEYWYLDSYNEITQQLAYDVAGQICSGKHVGQDDERSYYKNNNNRNNNNQNHNDPIPQGSHFDIRGAHASSLTDDNENKVDEPHISSSTGSVVASIVLSVVVTLQVCLAIGIAIRHVRRRRENQQGTPQVNRHRRFFASSPAMAFNSMTSKFSTVDFDDSISTISTTEPPRNTA